MFFFGKTFFEKQLEAKGSQYDSDTASLKQQIAKLEAQIRHDQQPRDPSAVFEKGPK